LLATATLFASGATALAQEKAERPLGTSFRETFDNFDTDFWYMSDGWTNGKHQNCGWSKDQVSVRDGVLHVGFAKGAKAEREYSCGEIQSKQQFGPGTFEARIKTPKGSGLNAAFFTYIGPVNKKPHDEIDFEFLLKDTSEVQLNSYVSAKGGNEFMAPLPAASDSGFHDYAFVWEPERLRWYVDGKLVHTIDDPAKVPSNNAKIFLSLWGTDTMTSWLGEFVDPGAPIAMEVDYVAYTAAGEDCKFPQSVLCQPAFKAASQ
jgi:endo-1,3-1,4-beta-glycanase ExoK